MGYYILFKKENKEIKERIDKEFIFSFSWVRVNFEKIWFFFVLRNEDCIYEVIFIIYKIFKISDRKMVIGEKELKINRIIEICF